MPQFTSKSKIFGVAKTLRNVQRLKEVLLVFIKNGLEELVIRTRLHLKMPELGISRHSEKIRESESGGDTWSILAHRLRRSFEELGPAFIKFGQLLSSREDLFPVSFTKELKHLQDDVHPLPFSAAEKIMLKALGRPWSEVFKSISPQALATASIGSVFRGELHDGSQVVLKVKKPGVERIIDRDFELMEVIVRRLERWNKEVRYLGLSHHLEGFYRTIKQECDFSHELRNLLKLKNNYHKRQGDDVLYFPKVYPELSNEEFLVMEYLEGTPFNKLNTESLEKLELKEMLNRCVLLFFQSLFKDGFFHADLHGGNFFWLPQQKKIGIIDFGLVGHLSPQGRQDLILILYYLISGNFQAVAHEFLDVAEYEKLPDIKDLARDLEDNLGPFIGLRVSELKVNEMLRMLILTLTKHEIFLPREWSTIFRAIITLDGLGRSIGFDINTFELLEGELNDLKGSFLSKESLMQDALGVGRQGLNVLRTFPHHLSWFMRELARRNYAFDVRNPGQNQALKSLSRSLRFLAFVILSGIFALCGTLLMPSNYQWGVGSTPVLSFVFYALSALGIFLALLVD